MTIAPAIVIGLSILGALLLIVGITGLIRDGRRIATPVYLAMGSGLLALGIGLWFSNLGNPAPLTIVVLIAGVVLLLGNIVGYPALVIFLLYSGLTILRKESRSLGQCFGTVSRYWPIFSASNHAHACPVRYRQHGYGVYAPLRRAPDSDADCVLLRLHFHRVHRSLAAVPASSHSHRA